jgi:ribosome-binding factor A
MSEARAERFNDLIKKELGRIIFDFLDVEPGILVTVTRVITNPNLFSSDVYVSVYPSSKLAVIMKKLRHSVFAIQQLLNKKLKVRPVPKIVFKYDRNPEEASEIEKLLDEVREEIKNE